MSLIPCSISTSSTSIVSSQAPERPAQSQTSAGEFLVPGTTARLVDKAVLLVPCAHAMNEESARQRFGEMRGECVKKKETCPDCEKPVTAYFVDHKMRSLHKKLPGIFSDKKSLADSSSQSKRAEIVDLRKELSCPIDLEFLAEGVALIPCAHRVNKSAAEHIYGKMEGEFCQKQLETCMECRGTVKGYIPDPRIQEVSKALERRLDEIEENLSVLLPLQQSQVNPVVDQLQILIDSASAAGSPFLFEPVTVERDLGAMTVARTQLSSDPQVRNAAHALAEAVAARPLRAQELIIAKENGSIPNDEIQQINDEELQLRTDSRLLKYYDAIKQRMGELGLNLQSPELGVYLAASVKLLNEEIERRNNGEASSALIQLKKDTTAGAISKKIYVEISNGLAKKPSASITISAFRQKVAELRELFAHNNPVDVEAALRQVLKANQKQAFRTLSSEFLNPDPANPRVLALKRELKILLETEKAEIEAELSILNGPGRSNGAIETASRAKEAACAALNDARNELRRAYSAASGGNLHTIDRLLALDHTALPVAFQEAKANFLARHAEFDAAGIAFDSLVARSAQLAIIRGPDVVGGRLAQILVDLDEARLSMAARNQARRIGNFYRELDAVVTPANKQARYDQLRAIIGS
ncbi:MAG: hypothetical protein JSS60_04685 [Verrucomicrobia bacterium]|nr:hypothetical protein [Verrucomicrobiota bacterium]